MRRVGQVALAVCTWLVSAELLFAPASAVSVIVVPAIGVAVLGLKVDPLAPEAFWFFPAAVWTAAVASVLARRTLSGVYGTFGADYRRTALRLSVALLATPVAYYVIATAVAFVFPSEIRMFIRYGDGDALLLFLQLAPLLGLGVSLYGLVLNMLAVRTVRRVTLPSVLGAVLAGTALFVWIVPVVQAGPFTSISDQGDVTQTPVPERLEDVVIQHTYRFSLTNVEQKTTLYGDGRVEHQSGRHLRPNINGVAGATSAISRDDVKWLVGMIRRVDFFSLDDKLKGLAELTPSETTLSVTINGEGKTIRWLGSLEMGPNTEGRIRMMKIYHIEQSIKSFAGIR